MKFYVFCNATYDGGWIEEFNTLQEAIDYMKKDSDAERLFIGQELDIKL